MEHTVEIKKGPHSTQIPSGTQKLFRRLFDCSDFEESYIFKVKLGPRLRGAGEKREIEVLNADEKHQSVVVACMPGDNGTRFSYYVFRPDGYTGSPEEFQQKLKKGEEKMNLFNGKKKETEPVLEDLGVATNTGEGMMKTEKEAGETPIEKIEPKVDQEKKPGTDSTLPRKRLVSEVLDKEIITILLQEIGKGGCIKQNEFRKRIASQGLNCDEKRIILFLKKNGYIKGRLLNRTRAEILLTEKGRKLIGLKKEKGKVNPSPKKSPQISERKISNPLLTFEALKADLKEADKDLALAEQQLAEAQLKVSKIKEQMEVIKSQVLNILKY